MTHSEAAGHKTSSVGSLLQYWRRARHLSQLALANEADVSPRHVCFLETGRAKPSRDMVLLLATVLDVPLREQNALLLAAGFAPMYKETSLDAPELGAVRSALDAILRQQEPFPAIVMNRRFDILRLNAGAQRFFAFLLGERATSLPPNLLRAMFHPDGLRPHVANWDIVAETLVRRVQREMAAGIKDDETTALLEEILNDPTVPERLCKPNRELSLLPVIPVMFQKDGVAYPFFSTITTLGTPQDITLQEVHIECAFPADRATEERVRALASDQSLRDTA